MTYRETIISNLCKTKDAIRVAQKNEWNSSSKVAIHIGYIDNALKLLKQDKERLDVLKSSLSELANERKAVKPKSGVFYCFCGKCGNTMQKTDKFCSQCGKEIDWEN